jgi:hypothetical protein
MLLPVGGESNTISSDILRIPHGRIRYFGIPAGG